MMLTYLKSLPDETLSLANMEYLLFHLQANQKKVDKVKVKPAVKYKIGAWLLTGFDMMLGGLGGYITANSLLSLLYFLPNPVLFVVSLVTAIFPALVIAGLNTGDSKRVFDLKLFPGNVQEK